MGIITPLVERNKHNIFWLKSMGSFDNADNIGNTEHSAYAVVAQAVEVAPTALDGSPLTVEDAKYLKEFMSHPSISNVLLARMHKAKHDAYVVDDAAWFAVHGNEKHAAIREEILRALIAKDNERALNLTRSNIGANNRKWITELNAQLNPRERALIRSHRDWMNAPVPSKQAPQDLVEVTNWFIIGIVVLAFFSLIPAISTICRIVIGFLVCMILLFWASHIYDDHIKAEWKRKKREMMMESFREMNAGEMAVGGGV